MTAPETIKEHLRPLWESVAAEALEHGYDEVQAAAIANTVAITAETEAEPVVIYDYPAWRPGKYSAAKGGEFEVTDDNVEQMADAINRLYQLGHPVALIDGHGSGYALGSMPAARTEGAVLRSAMVVGWMAAHGIKSGTYGLSVEASRDYSSEAYTGGETFAYWPTAWAVLPAGEQPAVPPGEPIAAKEEPKPVRLYAQETAPDGGGSPKERGQDTMTIEELTAKVTELEASQGVNAQKVSALEVERDGLKAKLEAAEKERDDFKAAKAAEALKAAEAETTKRAEQILAAAVPGTREKMQKRLEAAEGTEAKKILLDAWEPLIMDEEKLAVAKLQASEAKPDGKKTNADSLMDEAERIQAAEKCTWNEALGKAKRNKKEGE